MTHDHTYPRRSPPAGDVQQPDETIIVYGDDVLIPLSTREIIVDTGAMSSLVSRMGDLKLAPGKMVRTRRPSFLGRCLRGNESAENDLRDDQSVPPPSKKLCSS